MLRLFQVSRRFNVEIQPQWVLLQKTLLNVRGGRQRSSRVVGPAQPFLEKWIRKSDPKAVWQRLFGQAPYLSSALPQIPRLVHQALERRNVPPAPVIIKTTSVWASLWLAIIAFSLLAIWAALWVPLLLD